MKIKMHEVYLPFTKEELSQHFAAVKQRGECVGTAEQHVRYYRESIKDESP